MIKWLKLPRPEDLGYRTRDGVHLGMSWEDWDRYDRECKLKYPWRYRLDRAIMTARRWCKIPHKLRKSVYLWWQRRTRGWSDDECWNLDHSLAKHILPRLVRFRDMKMSYPSDLTPEDWNARLNKMILAFEWLASETRWEEWDTPTYVQEGLNLFAAHYMSLWD